MEDQGIATEMKASNATLESPICVFSMDSWPQKVDLQFDVDRDYRRILGKVDADRGKVEYYLVA